MVKVTAGAALAGLPPFKTLESRIALLSLFTVARDLVAVTFETLLLLLLLYVTNTYIKVQIESKAKP